MLYILLYDTSSIYLLFIYWFAAWPGLALAVCIFSVFLPTGGMEV